MVHIQILDTYHSPILSRPLFQWPLISLPLFFSANLKDDTDDTDFASGCALNNPVVELRLRSLRNCK